MPLYRFVNHTVETIKILQHEMPPQETAGAFRLCYTASRITAALIFRAMIQRRERNPPHNTRTETSPRSFAALLIGFWS